MCSCKCAVFELIDKKSVINQQYCLEKLVHLSVTMHSNTVEQEEQYSVN